jgi:hypothetical protein
MMKLRVDQGYQASNTNTEEGRSRFRTRHLMIISVVALMCMGSYLFNAGLELNQYSTSGWNVSPDVEILLFPPTLRSPLVPRVCRSDAPTIVIPAVRKGPNNQRMRIVQDILGAVILGANVQLPPLLYSREGCHYQGHCFNSYSSNVPLWDVYDRETTLRLLGEFGICVVEPNHGGHSNVTAPLLPAVWPMSTSQLSHMAHDGSLRLGNGVWTLAGVNKCCTILVPDSIETADLLRQINFAFQTSLHMSEFALQVGRGAMIEAGPLSTYVALHWRNNEDFTQTAHKLNSTAYNIAAARSLQVMRTKLSISREAPLHVVVLGDLNMTALKAIEATVNRVSASLEPAGGDGRFVFHSKVSLVPTMNLTNISPSEDVRGQVDFEIGVRAPAFIGSFFSSFSVLVAFQRSYQSRPQTAMLYVDTTANMGAILKLQFPYEPGISDNPCAGMISVYERARRTMLGCSRKASSSCPELATGFVFEPALDDPRGLNGLICDKVVITVLFGAADSLQVDNVTSAFSSVHTCGFAFLNAEAADAIGVKAGVPFGPLPMYSLWNIIVLDNAQLPFGPDPRENSRNSQAVKMLAHRAFRFARVMVYLDSQLKVLPQGKLGEFVDADSQQPQVLLQGTLGEFVNTNLISRSAAWVSPHHTQRLSAYTEAQCRHNREPVGNRALEQMAIYKSKSFPSAPAQRGGPGLIEGEWHLRDLRRPESAMIGCEWFREFESWGHRHGQLSFNYAVWSLFTNATNNDAVPSNPAFLYPTHNATWYMKSPNSSSIICDPDTGIYMA